MPTAKKTKTAASAKKKTTKTSAKKQSAAPALDWAATIKKAAAEKRAHATWPGTGESWKKKARF